MYFYLPALAPSFSLHDTLNTIFFIGFVCYPTMYSMKPRGRSPHTHSQNKEKEENHGNKNRNCSLPEYSWFCSLFLSHADSGVMAWARMGWYYWWALITQGLQGYIYVSLRVVTEGLLGTSWCLEPSQVNTPVTSTYSSAPLHKYLKKKYFH